MNNEKSIIFFYPSKTVGGAQYLILRLADQLSNQGLKVYLIDFEDGFVWSKLAGKLNIGLIKYNLSNRIFLPDNSTLVIFPSYIDQIKRQIDNSTKTNLIVWFIQPYLLINKPKYKNLVRLFVPIRVGKVKNLLNALNKKKALVFMDEENFNVNKNYFNLHFEPDYLPVPTVIKTQYLTKKEKQNFNIAWIGRVSNEKVESIRYLLNDIFSFNKRNKKQIKFHVIGDGNAINLLKEDLKKHVGTEVVFKGILIEKELESYLLNEIDCVFAMGTSALDAASYKIATILIDFTSKGFKNLNYLYKYKWLFDTKGFILGQDVSYYLSNNKLILDDVIIELSEDEGNKIGDKCFEYVYNNHNIQKIASMLISKANKSTFLLSENFDYNINHTMIIKHMLSLKKYFSNKIRHGFNL